MHELQFSYVFFTKITTSKLTVMDGDVFGVLQMYAVGVGTFTGRRDGYVVYLHSHAVIELEVELGAVLNCDTTHHRFVALVEPHRLQQRH